MTCIEYVISLSIVFTIRFQTTAHPLDELNINFNIKDKHRVENGGKTIDSKSFDNSGIVRENTSENSSEESGVRSSRTLMEQGKIPSVVCSCSNFINPNGYGKCKKKHLKFAGFPFCYVNLPSNCNDLIKSTTDPGQFMSASACSFGQDSELNLIEVKDTREQLAKNNKPEGLYDVVNVEILSDDMTSNLLQAVIKLKNSSDWNRITSIHGDPVRPECSYRYCCVHEDSGGFVSWHRIYMNLWNKALIKHKAGIIMPYWDWTTTNIPSIVQFFQIKDPTTGQTIENPLFRGFKQYANEDTKRNKTEEPLNDNLQRVFNALKEDDFDLFSSQIQLLHNDVHDRVGGDMNNIAGASYDPIFYMHHSFMDLIWAVYQKLKPNSLPSTAILHREGDLYPFSYTNYQTLDYNNFGTNYNLNISSDRIVFGGMTLAEINTQITGNGDYEDYNDKMFAGFFLKNFQNSGKIKYNCCNKNDCSYTCGKVTVFGGPKQIQYISSNPSKYDVTDTVKKAGITFDNLRFKVIGFEDLEGNKLPMAIYQPISIRRQANKGKDVYKISFNRHYKQPPVIRVPKICSIQIDSSHKNVFQTQNKYIFDDCNQNSSSVVPSGKVLDIKPGNYYYFDKDCNFGSSIYINKE